MINLAIFGHLMNSYRSRYILLIFWLHLLPYQGVAQGDTVSAGNKFPRKDMGSPAVGVLPGVTGDSLSSFPGRNDRYEVFYDSLRSKAQTRKFTRMLHRLLITAPRTPDTLPDSSLYASPLEGKTIGTIDIIRLDVFGPSIRDTSRKATLWYEKAGNLIHTRSDLHNIRKNLLFRKGEPFLPEELYENERILRTLPYIRDARFLAHPDTLNGNLVNITLLVQDRFSIGVTGNVNSPRSAALEIYNRNIFGVGHEVSARFVGHLTREPYTGIETYYRINNIGGRFISFSAGYLNTYLNEGGVLLLDKNFLRTTDRWGYGVAGYLMKRTPYLPGELHIRNGNFIGFTQWSAWGGRNLQVGRDPGASQFTLAAQIIDRHFTDRPPPLPGGEQYYFHSRLWMTGFTWSKRSYKPDELVYSYGITEDIPRGFRHEVVMGFDQAETGPRYYSHLFLSHGNFPGRRPGYLYLAGGIGGFLESGKVRQGSLEFSSRFISRLFTSGNARFRQFINIDYKTGINRFEKEKLTFEKTNLIRGFESSQVFGQQRLSLNMETVYFQKREFYRFNVAFFTFGDLGIIASAGEPVFRGSYYSGLGVGLRVHNESLVFKTLQVRLSIYPNHPGDVGLLGFLLNEHTRQSFYSFQPEPPSPRKFE